MKHKTKKRVIHYINFYARPDDKHNLDYSIASLKKIEYLWHVMTTLGVQVKNISACRTKNRSFCIYRGRQSFNSSNVLEIYLGSLSAPFRFLRGLAIVLHKINLFLYLCFKVKKNDIVLFYHSLYYLSLLNLAHRIKKFCLVAEIEEIYADVLGKDNLRKKEIEFADEANGYIFPTQMLNAEINTKSKPAAIIYGTYHIEYNRKYNIFSADQQRHTDDVIHCVYAGTLDPRKGGGIAAAAAAEFLPPGYHIHILGFGTHYEVTQMKNLVDKISKRSAAKVSYDGLLMGEDFIRFIQSCDIGLSTQNPNAAFNATSFPSKILSYMANGLRVVSIRIPVVEQSQIGDSLFYYDEQNPKQIAKAILSVDMKKQYDSRKLIAQLADNFEKDLAMVLNEVHEVI